MELVDIDPATLITIDDSSAIGKKLKSVTGAILRKYFK